jgi:hypothetical protein
MSSKKTTLPFMSKTRTRTGCFHETVEGSDEILQTWSRKSQKSCTLRQLSKPKSCRHGRSSAPKVVSNLDAFTVRAQDIQRCIAAQRDLPFEIFNYVPTARLSVSVMSDIHIQMLRRLIVLDATRGLNLDTPAPNCELRRQDRAPQHWHPASKVHL